jgi:CheY-like chemotaxis protein
MKILVVDDNTDALKTMGALLTCEGHTVTLASDPTDALGHAAALSPDVVVLDIGMPKLDGYQLAKAIRALEGKPRPLIIAVSGYDGPEHRARGRLAGFDFHFSKTVSAEAVLQVIVDHATWVLQAAPQPKHIH